MKKIILLIFTFTSIILSAQPSAPTLAIRNALLGFYSGTYQDYSQQLGNPVLAGVRLTALPNDTIGMIAHDTINNITDTIYVVPYTDFDGTVVDTGIYYAEFIPCGDYIQYCDSLIHARCYASNGYNPMGEYRLKCVQHTFPTDIMDNYKVKLIIYPNPAQTAIRILNGEHYTNYQIVNSVGQCIMSGKLDNNEIEISGLSNGIYYVRVNNRNSQWVKLLVKN